MIKALSILLLIPCLAFAGVSSTNTSGISVSFTNTQSNYYWTPSAVIVTRVIAGPLTIGIFRHGDGSVVKLAEISATASTIIWTPPAKFIFGKDSSLEVTCTAPGFVAQLHREAASD